MVSLWHHSMRFSLRNKGGVLERSGLTGDSVNMLLLNEMRILEESLRSLRGITARDQGIRGIIFVFSDCFYFEPHGSRTIFTPSML